MAVILDTGALIAYERDDARVIAFLKASKRDQIPVRTSTAAVAQAWRAGSRQVRLVRLLRGVDERSLDPGAARRVGHLLGSSATVDVVDAAVIDCARSGDRVLTSDPGDLTLLAEAANKQLAIIPVGR